MTISIVVVDDQPLVRMGFRMVLNATDEFRVVGEAGDGATGVRVAEQLSPDVVLMDVRMPGMDGVEATRRICANRAAGRVLVLTTFDLDEYAFAALRAGASGFLLKDVRPEELVDAVRAVAAGDAVVSPRITRELLNRHAASLQTASERAHEPDPAAALTRREREVLLEVAAGLTNAEIAERLFLSEATVKTHITRILAKLELRDRVQAVIFAYQNGLIVDGQPSRDTFGEPTR
ncbi:MULTISPECIES: response regulator transcription factor [unclassified Pseudofrankia]|uniref:response regulator n=1 Tax=unclassified Pseudofrankia TaxID=2994372 RepID=UPI0008DA820C|nr:MULTISPECIES: response regulator transcription factor [unclassified Pseudofrankia]MDT3439948.1 response regulator transcription factor [Pseudofrankia sp. BMG5.37]OHV48410.1 DNA-binding response regulator [Pseudofrankia sp. BMG5.36]